VEHHQGAMAKDFVYYVGQQSKDIRENLRRRRLHSEHCRWIGCGEDEEDRALQLQGDVADPQRAHGLMMWLLIS
jgi:hypothetical protein